MKNMKAFMIQLSNLKHNIHQEVHSPPKSPKTQTQRTHISRNSQSTSKMMTVPSKSSFRGVPHSLLQQNLNEYNGIQKEILNTKCLNEKKDFSRSKSTFGNPYRNDKFDRRLFVPELRNHQNLGEVSPAPGHYKFSSTSFSKQLDLTNPTIPRERRDFARILMKKDAEVIPSPGYYQSEKYLRGDYATMFNLQK